MKENKPINWKASNFLKSKEGNLIVVNQPNGKEDQDFFSGTIIYANESKTNSAPHYSSHFRKSKFEKALPGEYLIHIK
jgi:hypothetical protein